MHLVLLPGLDGSGLLFEEFLRHTPPGITTQVIPYPPSTPCDYDGCADYVRERLPREKPFVVLGESFSGPVAILLAARKAEGLSGVILCNTFACSPAWRGLRFLPWRLGFRLPMPRYKVGYYLVGMANASRWVGPVRAANAEASAAALAARMRSVLTVDVRKELERLDVPVLYLRGTQDRLVTGGSLQRIQQVKPDTEVASMEGPHMLLQLCPDDCWGHIVGFGSANSKI